LTDAIWGLAETCWVKDPQHRPTASAVCTTLSHLSSIPRSTPISPSRPSNPPRHLVIRGHTAIVRSAVFSPDGKHIISGSGDRTICVWDAQTGNLALGPFKIHTDEVDCVAVSPTGRQMASASIDLTIVVWDAVVGRGVGRLLEGHTSTAWVVSFSPDGEKIVSGSADKTIRIWDAQTGRLLVGPLSGHTAPVISVAFSGNGTRIASGSQDKTVRVWDAKSGSLLWGPLIAHRCRVDFVAFSLDAKRVISLSSDGIVCVWNVETQVLVSGPSLQHPEDDLAVGFLARQTLSAVSPDGKWAAVPGYDNTVLVRDAQTGLFAAHLEGHIDELYSLGFSPDSRQIVSASRDKTIRVHTLDL
jgi:WD40 repeat protein